ncbi:MAG: hypothetical protein JNK63_02965 [Chthonomonas sp.]|nr:hypothetical protein [Chthonomonas sp.]
MRKLMISSLFLLPLWAIAQDMPAMTPPKEMDVFKGMIGKWSGKMTWEMPDQPKMEFMMKMENSWDGQFMKSANVMEMEGMKMTETMYFGWDPEKKKYKSWSFTNWAPTPRIEWGVVDGNKSVWDSEPWDGGMGEKTTTRATMTIKDAKNVHFLLEFKMGDKYAPVMSGTLTKS